MTVPVLTLVVLLAIDGINTWKQAMPLVPIGRDTWRAIYDSSPAACGTNARATPGCLAAPETPTLWQSPDFRSADTHRARVMSRVGKEFWIGATIPAAVVRQAASIEATRLIVGYLNADFEVWVDGERYLDSTWKSTKFPAIVTLPPTLLERGEAIAIAIRAVHTVGSLAPDALATNRQEGLTTAAGAEHYLKAENVENHTRPAIFLGAYAIMGLLALGFWASHHVRKDFLFIGLYAIFHAGLLIVESNASNGFLSLDMKRTLRIFTLAYEGGLALMFGLAWARTRRGVMNGFILAILPLPFLIRLFVTDPQSLRSAAMMLHAWFVPTCYALGAVACLLQGANLLGDVKKRHHLMRRGRRLLAVGFALLALGVGYWLESATAFSITEYAVWYRLSNIGVVAFFFVISVYDFSEMDRLARQTPISDYHRTGNLPGSVAGALINIDIKGSEILIQKGAELGQSGHFLLICLSHMWSAVTRHGGIVLQTDGDALLGFFERHDQGEALTQAVKALESVGRDLESLSEQFRAAGVLVPGAVIHVRASIAHGSIKPVWQEAGGQRSASWTGAGNINVFLLAARLQELERQINPDSVQSNVIMLTEEAAHLPAHVHKSMRWTTSSVELSGKSGKTYVVSSFAVGTAVTPDKLQRAG